MTIRPTTTAFVLLCDGAGCTQTRPLTGLDDIAQAIRIGWRRILTDRPIAGHWIAGHHCARCARRSPPIAEPAEVVPIGVPIGDTGFWLLPGEVRS